MKRFLLSLVFLSSSAFAEFKKEDVRATTLKNGMKVLLLKDSSIPNANMYTFWKVGSRNEVPGITGLSHFFEHMMFNGSKNYPPGSFDKVMEAAGGANNAYTTSNVTVYTNWFPSTALSTIIDLEADRIASLQIDDKMVQSERGVVLSERSTGLENNPWEELEDTMRSTAFVAHTYSLPVIGWESDIKAWTKQDLVNYFNTYYNPANAVTVLVGDLDLDATLKILKDKIEPISRKNEVPPVRTVEPPQKGERRVWVVKESVSNPHIALAYHVPETKHADSYALELLGNILSDGPSSRLYKILVDEKRLAIEVGAGPSQSFDPDLFTISVVAHEGKSPALLEKTIDQELEKMKKNGVSERELEKAKNKSVVDFYRSIETINGKAQVLGNFEVFNGSYEEAFKAPDRIRQVTSADIKRVLNSYFSKSNRTVGVLDQKEEASR